MADAAISMPKVVQFKGNMAIQKSVQSDGGNTFLARSLVKMSAGLLAKVATADILVFGLSPDANHLTTDQPPVAFNGQNHWPLDILDAILEINVTNGTGAIGVAGSAPQGTALTLGSQYGIYTGTAGAINGIQFINSADTTNKIFQVVGFSESGTSADYNARVLVKVVPSTVQA